MTGHPQLFHDLSEPFDEKHEVKILPKGKGIRYVTARTVMNRLDKVLGPENWWDDYTQTQNGVVCKLTVRLPDGREITKVDAGGHAGMSDEGDDEKSGYSDAFKRAAVKFGVGRHLYGDGIPAYIDETPKQATAKPAKSKPADVAAELKQHSGPRTTPEFMEYLKSIDPDRTSGHIDFIKAWGKRKGFSEMVIQWTDGQAREAYPVMVKQVEAEEAMLAKESK